MARKLLTVTWTEQWMETTCGHCPDFSIKRIDALGPLNGPRERLFWQWHKRTAAHKANRDRLT